MRWLVQLGINRMSDVWKQYGGLVFSNLITNEFDILATTGTLYITKNNNTFMVFNASSSVVVSSFRQTLEQCQKCLAIWADQSLIFFILFGLPNLYIHRRVKTC